MSARHYFLTNGISLRQSPSGWYMLDWDGRAIAQEDVDKAVHKLGKLIQTEDLPPAAMPARYVEDHFQTAEEALLDLARHKGAKNPCPDNSDPRPFAVGKEKDGWG